MNFNNIINAKGNFYIVKDELLEAVNKCKNKEQNLIFGSPCEQNLTTKIISDYFNETKNLIHILKKKSISEIKELMSLSDNLARLNWQRFYAV